MGKHSQGPWKAVVGVRGAYATGSWIIMAGNKTVADVQTSVVGSGPEWYANARLIAAAPEMLEAARALLEGCAEDRDPTHISRVMAKIHHIEALRTAIAKAEGRAP